MRMIKAQKKDYVNSLKKDIANYKTVAIMPIDTVPDRLLQKIRNKLKPEARMVLGRKSLVIRALGEERMKPLEKYMSKNFALVLSNKEPFELYKDISQSKLKLGAKPKQISPSDILIESGETSIAPGQTVTELKAAGIDVQIQKGKVVISKDKVLVAKGARISGAVANALKILDIKPFEIAPRLDVAVSGGMIYSADVLKVDEEFVKAEISRIFMEAYAMSLELGIPTQYNAKVLIERAYNGAIAVGIEGKIAEPEITAILLAKGAEQAVELAAEAGVDEAKKEE